MFLRANFSPIWITSNGEKEKCPRNTSRFKFPRYCDLISFICYLLESVLVSSRYLESSTFISSSFHVEKCYVPGIDFGILYNGNASLSDDQMNDAASKIQQLLLPIYKTFRYHSYNFIWNPKSSRNSGFKSYSEVNFIRQILNYVNRPIRLTVYEDIAASFKTQLTELNRSFSKVKFLLVITKIPLDEEALRPHQVSFYGEKINIYNFVLDSSLVEKYDGPFSPRVRLDRLTYGADNAEIDEFIQVVKNKSHRICQ